MRLPRRTPGKREKKLRAWPGSTEPEFQKKLDWVEDLCKNEVEPLSYVFPYAVRSRHPKVRALVTAGATFQGRP